MIGQSPWPRNDLCSSVWRPDRTTPPRPLYPSRFIRS
jgi:hypothetical protein